MNGWPKVAGDGIDTCPFWRFSGISVAATDDSVTLGLIRKESIWDSNSCGFYSWPPSFGSVFRAFYFQRRPRRNRNCRRGGFVTCYVIIVPLVHWDARRVSCAGLGRRFRSAGRRRGVVAAGWQN